MAFSPLQVAVQNGWTSIVKLLLQFGADVHYAVQDCYSSRRPLAPENIWTWTRLPVPKFGPKSLMRLAINAGKSDIVELLINHGLDVNETMSPCYPNDRELANPLGAAWDRGELHIFKLLLEHKANPNAPCATIHKDKLPNYVNPEELDEEYITVPNVAWLLACLFPALKEMIPTVLPLLVTHGVDLNIVEPITKLQSLELLYYSNLNFEIHKRQTLDSVPCIKSFISCGADINVKNHMYGGSLLHGLVEESHIVLPVRKQQEILPLIDLVAPDMEVLDVKGKHGTSALYLAVQNGLWDLAESFVKHGASLWAEDWFLKQRKISRCSKVNHYDHDSDTSDDIQEVTEVKDETYQDRKFAALYGYFFEHQMNLQFMCRVLIRAHLRSPFNRSVQQLQIPRCFKDYLLKLT